MKPVNRKRRKVKKRFLDPTMTKTPIADIADHLTLRIINSLENEGILYVEDLFEKSYEEIVSIRNIGVATFDVILSVLISKGIKIPCKFLTNSFDEESF